MRTNSESVPPAPRPDTITSLQKPGQDTVDFRYYGLMRALHRRSGISRWFPGAGFRHGDRKGCLKGTRGAVLDKIELWTGNFSDSPVYWLSGLAGTGKTTIAQTIAERTFADGQLGASFFCSRDYQDRSGLHLIFPTLAVQLARKYTDFRSIFAPLVQSDPEIAHESLYNQMHKLIVEPLEESDISTVIVIDALDECGDEEPASAILSVLGQFVSEIPKVKFFVTGRPEPRIQEGFRLPLLAEATDVFVLHEVEPSQVDHDIRLISLRNSWAVGPVWMAGQLKNNWTSFASGQRDCSSMPQQQSSLSTSKVLTQETNWTFF
jgi:hypothetical protein